MSGEHRSGVGYDSHRLVEGRKLLLGGVEIPFEKGFLGHSDGDILLHALTDAVLGAAALGDIGQHFPPSDPQWENADSLVFLRHARELVEARGYRIVNVDAVVVIERPKILTYREQIRGKISQALGIETDRVSVKAKTAEGIGPVGAGESAEAHAVAVLCREGSPSGQ